jgi:hypothetical protein
MTSLSSKDRLLRYSQLFWAAEACRPGKEGGGTSASRRKVWK